jgi:GAF domain-containing protein
MFTNVSNFLAANILGMPDPQEDHLVRQQRLLNLVLLGLAVPNFLFGMTMIVLALLGTAPWVGAIAGLGVQPFYLVSFWLGKRGKLRLAGYIPVIAVFLAMFVVNYQIGLDYVTYIGYAMATLAATILIGPGAGIFFAFLSTLAHYGLGLVQASIGLPAALSPLNTVFADSISLGLGLIVLVIFTTIYGYEINQALERQKVLSTELKNNQATLELQIARRTNDLERRLLQLRTAAEISRTIGAVLQPKELMDQVVDLVQTRFKLYYVGVFLLDKTGEYAVLQSGSGEAGKMMLSEGHRLEVGGNSMIGWTTAHRQARIALDVGAEAVRFQNPHLPETRSELALPILKGSQTLGAMTVQSTQAKAFDQDDITILQSIADSLAIALENARLFSEVQSNLDEIQTLHHQYLAQAWSEASTHLREMSYSFEQTPPQTSLEPSETQSSLEVPLVLRDQVIGNLTLETKHGNLTPEERAFIDSVTTQATLALENVRLLEETQRRAERERITAHVSSHVWASNDIHAILRTALKELGDSLQVSEGSIQLDTGELPYVPIEQMENG